jgi:DNA primase
VKATGKRPFSIYSAHGCLLTDDRGSLTKRVKEANDIVDVVGTYVALRPVGKKFKGLCPFHDDHRPSFDVDPQFQNYRCWSCGKNGDVFNFIQDHERVSFPEALELLARRAGITLEKTAGSPPDRGRAVMLDLVKWAEREFQLCLRESPQAETARKYLQERGLNGETLSRFGVGFAPDSWDWLTMRAAQAGHSAELLEKVGLLAPRREGNGYYDRFRDRVMFPIRDARGQTVGFGGRILPSSPLSDKWPKYINSSETPLFKKSEQLYGLDHARQAGMAAGYLAVVEGYTDVLMAHQMGVSQVVATLGTALNARHVQHLRRFVPKVVLIFDADAGGNTGVDRALEIFVSQNVDLAIATLPEGKDPCDFLVEQGRPEPFKQALAEAKDALDFKLKQLLSADTAGVEGRRQAVEKVLSVIALAPELPGAAGEQKQQLIVNRIAQQMGLQEKTVWARLQELKATVRRNDSMPRRDAEAPTAGDGAKQKPAPPLERQLLEVLLARPELVETAAAEISAQEIAHEGLRLLLEGLYALRDAGEKPELDSLRSRIDNSRLLEKARELEERGRHHSSPATWLEELLREFRRRRTEPERQEVHNQLHAAVDHMEAVELLRRLQAQTVSVDPGATSLAGGARP